MVINACNLVIWETEAGRLSVQGQPGLYSEFEVSPMLKQNEIIFM